MTPAAPAPAGEVRAPAGASPLLPAAGSVWATVALLVGHGPRTALVAAAVALVGLVVLRRAARTVPRAQVVWMVCAAAAAAAVVVAGHVAVRDAGSLATQARTGGQVVLTAVVRSDPLVLPTRAGPPTVRVTAAAVLLEAAERRTAVRGRVVLTGPRPTWQALRPGERVRVRGTIGPPDSGDRARLVAARVTATEAPAVTDTRGRLLRVADVLRSDLADRSRSLLGPDTGGLLPGLVVGDTSGLPETVADDFERAGLTHLTSVSGTNVTIVVGAVLLVGTALRLGPRSRAVVAGLALVALVVLARPSPSVLRAGAMGALAVLGLAMGRRRHVMPALAAAVVGLLLVDPALGRSAGFALSVVATAAIVVLVPRWSVAWTGRSLAGTPAGTPAGTSAGAPAETARRGSGVRVRLAGLVAVPLAAQCACAPVLAAMGGGVGLVAVPANMLVAPAVVPVTVLGFAALVLGPVWGWGADLLVRFAGVGVGWLVLVAGRASALPGAVLPWPSGIGGAALAAALLAVLWVAPTLRRIALAAVAGILVVVWPLAGRLDGWPPPDWAVVACDVGQGDMFVLRSETGVGSAAVVDAGGDPSAAQRCLDDLGVRDVPLLLVSHGHRDHVGGVPGVLRGRAVRAVAGPASDGPAAVPAELAANLARVGLRVRPAEELLGSVPGVGLRAIGPVATYRGTRSDANNTSIVLVARVGGLSVLLTGDVEEPAQSDLVHRDVVGGVDVLKVPHHGSAYQDEAFLRAAGPLLALVGVGRDNDYGHPSAATVAVLASTGAVVVRTDVCGDVAVLRRGAGAAADPGRREPLRLVARRCRVGGAEPVRP